MAGFHDDPLALRDNQPAVADAPFAADRLAARGRKLDLRRKMAEVLASDDDRPTGPGPGAAQLSAGGARDRVNLDPDTGLTPGRVHSVSPRFSFRRRPNPFPLWHGAVGLRRMATHQSLAPATARGVAPGCAPDSGGWPGAPRRGCSAVPRSAAASRASSPRTGGVRRGTIAARQTGSDAWPFISPSAGCSAGFGM